MSGSGAVDVDVSGLAPGAYIVSLRSGNTEVSKRFLRLPWAPHCATGADLARHASGMRAVPSADKLALQARADPSVPSVPLWW